jgi:hypothetical protein
MMGTDSVCALVPSLAQKVMSNDEVVGYSAELAVPA